MLANQSADNNKTDDKNGSGPTGYAWDDDAELEKIVDEITKDRKPCPRPKIRINIPKNIKLPPMMEAASLIDLHNMSPPSLHFDEDAMSLIFDATNKTVGKPFSREREVEAIEIAQKMVPCAFCLTTKQAKNAAYKHTYFDKNGNVSCYLVLDFINRIHVQQGNSNNSLRATTSKEDIELVLRKTLEAKNTESLRSTWPLTSVSSRLSDVAPNNKNIASDKKSPRKFIPNLNICNFSAEKNEKQRKKTEVSIPSLITRSNKPKLCCSIENPFKFFKYQSDAEVSKANLNLGKTLSKSTFVTDLRNFITSSYKLNRPKASSYENIEENNLNKSLLKALKSDTMASEDQFSSEEDDDIPCNFNDDLFSIPNCGTNNAYLHSSPIREEKHPLNLCDNFTEDSPINDNAYFDEISFANHFSYPGIFSF